MALSHGHEKIKIVFINGYELEFMGEIRPDGTKTKNWKYYETTDGRTLHIPKNKILYIEFNQ